MKPTYNLFDSDGIYLDAAFELWPGTIVLRARGGTKGRGAVNPDYIPTLKLILDRLKEHDLQIRRAFVDSRTVEDLLPEDRLILSEGDAPLTPTEQFSRMSRAMEHVGQSGGEARKGNRTKRIVIELVDALTPEALGQTLKVQPRLGKIPDSELHNVTAEYIWRAVQKLQAGPNNHGYTPAQDFDLVLDTGERLPPKVVFGLAASEALGFTVLPQQFAGGLNSTCFHMLQDAGFTLVATGQTVPLEPTPTTPEERRWAEGNPKLVTHLRRERAPGIAQAKKSEFRRVHGHLYCEHCQMSPSEQYGEYGEACIEIHHKSVQVKDMGDGHTTQLADLECLCANCHRVEHMKLRAAQTSA